MWPEEDPVMISAIEHWSYCHRQCALIHVEQVYDENVFTLRGSGRTSGGHHDLGNGGRRGSSGRCRSGPSGWG